MHLFALRDQRVARERVGILAADQHADLADVRVADAQAFTVAIGPDQLLVKRRHQLAVMVDERAVGIDQQVGVPQAADRNRRALADADRNDDGIVSRGSAERGHLGPGHLDRICREALEEFVTLDGRLHRRPHRETGHEGFGKGDQAGRRPGSPRRSTRRPSRRLRRRRGTPAPRGQRRP